VLSFPGMTATLAFSSLSADAPRQRARCTLSGRFISWSKAQALRVPGAPRVVVVSDSIERPPVNAGPALLVSSSCEVCAVAVSALRSFRSFVSSVPPVVSSVVGSAVATVAAVSKTIIARAGRWFNRGGCDV